MAKIALALALFPFMAAAGCRSAVVRVPVSAEDLKRAEIAMNEGDVALARREHYPALIKYLLASTLNPNSPMIFSKLGIAYSRLRFYPDAIEAFNRSIALDSKYSYAYNNLGAVFFADGDKKKAESLFRKAISIKPEEASFHVNLGTLLIEKKKYDKGLQELRKGLALDPDILKRTAGDSLVASSTQMTSPERNYSMARLYASMGNAERALENLQMALTHGFTDLQAVRKEKDFDPIRNDEKFVAFMKYAAQIIR